MPKNKNDFVHESESGHFWFENSLKHTTEMNEFKALRSTIYTFKASLCMSVSEAGIKTAFKGHRLDRNETIQDDCSERGSR